MITLFLIDKILKKETQFKKDQMLLKTTFLVKLKLIFL